MDATQFIEMIIERRKALGISQTTLAHRIGSDQARVSLYEAGKVEPGLEFALRMLDAVSLAAVFEGVVPEEIDELG